MRMMLLVAVLCVASAAAASGPVVSTRDTVATVGGQQWVHKITDCESYFRISYDEETVFMDHSFSLCWPERLGKYRLDGLRHAILEKLAQIRMTVEEPPVYASLDEALADYASYRAREEARAERVDAIVADSDDETMPHFVNTHMDVERMSPRYVGYSFVQDGFLGGVVTHGVKFLNYDLKADRVLAIDDIVQPGALALVIEELKAMELWDELWDEFRENPYLSRNFLVDGDSLVLIYSRYEITYGAIGEVVIQLPYEKLKPYLKPIVKELL